MMCRTRYGVEAKYLSGRTNIEQVFGQFSCFRICQFMQKLIDFEQSHWLSNAIYLDMFAEMLLQDSGEAKEELLVNEI